MLTPMEIHNHEFKKGFRGYSENEVDDFLDQIVNDYEAVLRENDKLKSEIEFNAREVQNYKNLEQNLKDTISVAQKTADEVVATAQKTAEEIVSAAKKNSKELRDNALRDTQSMYDNTMKETQNLRTSAHLESKKTVDEAARKLHTIVNEYEKIVREKSSFLLKFRTALESELAVTVQLLASLPNLDDLLTLKSMLSKLEAENANFKPDEKISAEPPKKSELPAPKPVTTEKKSLVEKVTEVVANAEPLEKTAESPKNIVRPEDVVEDDLDKTMTYKPVKK